MTAAAASQTARESVSAFEAQLDGHQVRAVLVHTQAHHLRVTLKDGRKLTVAVPASRQQQLLSAVEASGVAVEVAKVQPPGHKRRDIAIAAAVVVVIVLVAGAWLLLRRRRMREEEYGPAGR